MSRVHLLFRLGLHVEAELVVTEWICVEMSLLKQLGQEMRVVAVNVKKDI